MQIRFSNADVLRAYMVFGGVPFYWTLPTKGMSIAQDVDALCFAKSGELRDEFDYLLGSLFARPRFTSTSLSPSEGVGKG